MVTFNGPKDIQVLFDTGANTFILSQEHSQFHNLLVMEREKPITLLCFSGQTETLFGKYFTPLLNIKVGDHVSQVFCAIGCLETEGNRII
jgi:hypothetical protein